MKFIHAADIHLDSPMSGFVAGSIDGRLTEVIRNCTRRAFSALVDLAIAEDAAFMVIAGDLYDGNWQDFSTGLFFAREVARFGRPCFLLRGNHDARSVITRTLTLPSNVFEFSSRKCETFERADFGVALHGHSFPNRAVPEDLSLGYPDPVRGLLNIGVLHTSAEDPGEHETYAPCSIEGLRLKGYDYWALGHIHAARVPERSPWIVFPGNLQGRHPKETGAKGCVVVTVQDGKPVAVDHRAVDVLRWAILNVDVDGADVHTLSGRITDAVAEAVAGAEGRPLLIRLTLHGTTDLHGALLDDVEQLAAECRSAGFEAGGEVWAESVRISTKPLRPATELGLGPLSDAFFAGLDEPGTTARLLGEMGALREKVPGPGRAALDLPHDEPSLRQLALDAWELTATRIEAAAARE